MTSRSRARPNRLSGARSDIADKVRSRVSWPLLARRLIGATKSRWASPAPGSFIRSPWRIQFRKGYLHFVSFVLTWHRCRDEVATPGLGFPYNNFLEAFRLDKPQCPGFLRPFAPCATDMAPSILVFRDGSIIALGTPGSNGIPSIMSGIISNMVDRGMSLRESVEAPRVLWGGLPAANIQAEITDAGIDTYLNALDSMGYELPSLRVSFPALQIDVVDFGGVNAALYSPSQGAYVGVIDGRRGGLAKGPRVVAASD
jgi:gamma-glutamyltranspeptidase